MPTTPFCLATTTLPSACGRAPCQGFPTPLLTCCERCCQATPVLLLSLRNAAGMHSILHTIFEHACRREECTALHHSWAGCAGSCAQLRCSAAVLFASGRYSTAVLSACWKRCCGRGIAHRQCLAHEQLCCLCLCDAQCCGRGTPGGGVQGFSFVTVIRNPYLVGRP